MLKSGQLFAIQASEWDTNSWERHVSAVSSKTCQTNKGYQIPLCFLFIVFNTLWRLKAFLSHFSAELELQEKYVDLHENRWVKGKEKNTRMTHTKRITASCEYSTYKFTKRMICSSSYWWTKRIISKAKFWGLKRVLCRSHSTEIWSSVYKEPLEISR